MKTIVQEILLPCITKTKTQENSATYVLEPLEVGYGRPFGNALRRVLLSSLPGAAVTSLQIEGIQHEFQAIEHVREDVTEIVLNMKKVRLRCFSDHPLLLHLNVRGECEVTAADIIVPSTVEIVNPDLHIATLDNEKAVLSMTLILEAGRGFAVATSIKDQPIGVIPVDALYTPMQMVSYTIETVSTEAATVEKLVLAMTTDGTITPDEALRESAAILARHMTVFANYRPSFPSGNTRVRTVLIPKEIDTLLLKELDLSVRTYNSFKRKNITTVGQVLAMNEDELLGIRNFGVRSLQELGEQLRARHLFPGSDDDENDDSDQEEDLLAGSS